ncbi:MAG: phenylalanine 4-monooxygenase [Bacteroidota bacterium]|nr:phenylalanine 4-monooxygenase [Bacteroidota bacterium]
MKRIKPLEQVYSSYKGEDFLVWKTLYCRQMEVLSKKASNDFLIAVKNIGFTPEKIPDFNEVNDRLMNFTGWKLLTVPCISPAEEFFNHLSEKKFTATCWIRKLSELDYLEEPDMFHDVFGHAPLLTNTDYCDFFHTIGIIATKHIHNEQIIKMLQRLYWFTIEFGLIEEQGELKVYGAGIISSKDETTNAFSNKSRKINFNVREIMNQEFQTGILQEKYFVINTFKQLKDSIKEIEEEIKSVIEI